MKTVMGELGASEDKMVKIMTSYHPAMMEKSLNAIAAKAGDPAAAAAYMKDYRAALEKIRGELKSAGLFGSEILVHFHQKPLAEALGFKILGVFGPAPLKASDIAKFGAMEPALILDNFHNPLAAPLAELSGAPVAELANFPGGSDGDGKRIPSDLKGVAEYNGGRILNLK
jgi:zinc transport system substrate-binding protein